MGLSQGRLSRLVRDAAPRETSSRRRRRGAGGGGGGEVSAAGESRERPPQIARGKNWHIVVRPQHADVVQRRPLYRQ